DEDNIPPASWENIVLAEVNGEGSGETSSILMSTVNARELLKPSGSYKGYWRLREEYKCAMKFSNSFGSRHLYVGKDRAGSYQNFSSGHTHRATYNAVIPAKAELTHTVGSTKWNFDNLWTRGEVNYATTQEISVTVDGANAEYIAQYTSGGTPNNFVEFENRSDNLPINSILKVNGENQRSKAGPYPVGASATAYQYLLSDRVHYTFSQWSTGTANLSITPSTGGTYIAHYNFDYVLPPAEVNTYGTAVGQPITISWTTVSNAYVYVDTIEVWRKVKNVHNPMVIARLSPTATQFIDYEYVLTDGYTDNLIEYDIRTRYKTWARTVYSSPNWFTVFGSGGDIYKTVQGSKVVTSSTAPEDFHLSIHPNPFNPSTRLSITLETSAYVELRIFNLTGQFVKMVSSGDWSAGLNTVVWDATDKEGTRMASGLYVLQVAVYPHDTSPAFTASAKLLLAR
ncbi:MAG: FlgD immunoglobulin-like domain containing protein, partial [Bacteroidota bacterium]